MRNRLTALAAGLAFAVLVAGLAVIGAGRDGGPPRLPRLTAAAGEATARLSAPADADSLSPGRYVAAGRLPDLPSRAPAYRLTRPTTGDVGRLAEGLGLRGKLTISQDWWSEADATHQVSGSFGGGGRWHYSEHNGCPPTPPGDGPPEGGGAKVTRGCVATSAPAMPAPDTPTSSPPADSSSASSPPADSSSTPPPPDGRPGGCKPCPPGRYCAQVCQIEPLPGLPTKEAAEATARQFLQRAGIGVTSAGMRIDGGYSSWSVRFIPRIGDLPTEGLETTVEVGPGDKVVSASGWLGRPERLGTYPVVSAARALARLNDPPEPPPATGRPEPMPLPDRAPPTGTPPAGAGSSPGKAPTEPSSPPAEPAPMPPADRRAAPPADPGPIPMPTLRSVPAHQPVTGARLVLTLVAQDQVTYLVPAVVFELGGDPERTAPPVPAVTERHLLPLDGAGTQPHR